MGRYVGGAEKGGVVRWWFQCRCKGDVGLCGVVWGCVRLCGVVRGCAGFCGNVRGLCGGCAGLCGVVRWLCGYCAEEHRYHLAFKGLCFWCERKILFLHIHFTIIVQIMQAPQRPPYPLCPSQVQATVSSTSGCHGLRNRG